MVGRIALVAALALVVATPFGGIASGEPEPAQSSLSRLMISGREFSFSLSRQRLGRGPALVQFVNRGEDAHDLRLKRIGSSRELRFPSTRAGALSERRIDLAPGSYRLWCSLPGHRKRGMRATLTVRR